MATIVQSRLDDQTRSLLDELTVQLGMNASEVVREGIRVLAACTRKPGKRRIIGQGQFDSGISDLATNKKHMEGFGRDRYSR